MRPLVFALILGAWVMSASSAHADTGPVKYWIFLADKQDVAGKSSLLPITERAAERRRVRGSGQPGSDLDREVSSIYVRALEQSGVVPLVKSRWLNAVSAWLDEDQVASVERLPFVRRVHPVGVAHTQTRQRPLPFATPTLPQHPEVSLATDRALTFNYGRSFDQLTIAGAIAPIESGLNGQGVRLGIIDTSIGPFTHPAIKPIESSGRLIARKDFTGLPDESYVHGLWVLSVAAGFEDGYLIGPAYGAEILHARTEVAYLDGVESETNQEEDNFVAGIEWMEAQGADVINVSLGYSEFDEGQRSYTYADMDGNTAITTVAADRAVSLGVVVVVAAGNQGCPEGPTGCWFYITSPADGDSVIAVGGVKSDLTKSGFSGYGPTSDHRTKPDVAAMGTGVYFARSTSGYSSGNGTSFAAPMVSGIVAMMLQANPALTPHRIWEVLTSTASQSTSPDNQLGWGIVNAEAAIAMVASRESPENPDKVIVSAWPNPFQESFRVSASLPPGTSQARLELFDPLGRRLAVYDRGTVWGYSWTLIVDGTDLPAGPVLYRLTTGDRSVAGSIVHTR